MFSGDLHLPKGNISSERRVRKKREKFSGKYILDELLMFLSP